MTEKTTTRRGFLLTGLRGLAGGAIVAVSAWLSLRSLTSRRGSSASNICIGDNLCRKCSRLETCILPLGISTREAKEKKN